MASSSTIIRLILGDQLNPNHSWFKKIDPNVIYAFFETQSELDYTQHHIQKVVGIFMAMRDFANKLKAAGHNVVYLKINAAENLQNFGENLSRIISENEACKLEYLEPDEYRVAKHLHQFCESIKIPHTVHSSEHFYTSRNELKTFFTGKKTYLMESFYRMMRKKHEVLMVGNNPYGGQWNFDKNNRNKWSTKDPLPNTLNFENNYNTVLNDLEQVNHKCIGQLEDEYFTYPINYEQAQELLDFFCKHLLMHFGTFQDAMHTSHKFLFHSKLSFALNLKIISPKEVIDTVVSYASKHPEIHIAQTEGFVRQILGWREYIEACIGHSCQNTKHSIH